MSLADKAQKFGMTRLRALDGLRGVCALSVVFAHLIWDSASHVAGNRVFPGYLGGIFSNFDGIAVVIFFALSGFVIGLTTPKSLTRTSLQEYAARRFIRVFPLYIVALLLSYLASPASATVSSIGMHVLFMQVLAIPSVVSNGSLWSLHYEFIFYLLYPLLWYTRAKMSLVVGALALISLGLVFSGNYIFSFSAYFAIWCSGCWLSQQEPEDFDRTKTFINPASIWFTIAAFSLANPIGFLLTKFGAPVPYGVGFRTPLLDLILTVPIAALIGSLSRRPFFVGNMATILLLVLTTAYTAVGLTKQNPLPQYNVIATYICFACFFSVMRFEIEGTLEKLGWVGDISYGLYVSHGPVLFVVLSLIKTGNDLWLVLAIGGAGLLIAIILATVLELHLQPLIAKPLREALYPALVRPVISRESVR